MAHNILCDLVLTTGVNKDHIGPRLRTPDISGLSPGKTCRSRLDLNMRARGRRPGISAIDHGTFPDPVPAQAGYTLPFPISFFGSCGQGQARIPVCRRGRCREAQPSVRALARPTPNLPSPLRAPGLEFERFFSRDGIDPFDEVEWETRSAVIGNEKGAGRLRAARRRDAALLVAAGHQHRRLEVLPRADRHAGARAQRQAADRAGGRHHHRHGRATSSTSPAKTIWRRSRTT